MKKNLKLGVFGFGCVGQGLYHVLHETRGVKAEIKRIVVKHKDKPRPIDEAFFTYDKEGKIKFDRYQKLVEKATGHGLREIRPSQNTAVHSNNISPGAHRFFALQCHHSKEESDLYNSWALANQSAPSNSASA